MTSEDIHKQLDFLVTIDALKSVYRASPLIDGSRKENSAEHSWHLAMYALVLGSSTRLDIDLGRVIKMLLLHDIVEIDAGDVPIHLTTGPSDQAERERKAANRLFGLLPSQQGEELKSIWLEFEAAQTQDAKFAKSLDRLQPLMQNVNTGGGTWIEGKVSEQQVYERYGPTIQNGGGNLWSIAKTFVRRHFQSDSIRPESSGVETK